MIKKLSIFLKRFYFKNWKIPCLAVADKALILGCSHAMGSEMHLAPALGPISHPQENFGARNSYPVQIARILGYQPCNHAIAGGSNDAIFRIWMEQCHRLDASDIVIACWTGRYRSEILHEQDKLWLQISPGNESYSKRVPDPLFLEGRTTGAAVRNQSRFVDYTKQWQVFANDATSAINNKLKNIIALNESASRMAIRVINFDSFDPLKRLLLKQFEWPLQVSFTDFAQNHGFQRTDWGHYFIDAHNAYAVKATEPSHG